jgi:thioester reductase-like protein
MATYLVTGGTGFLGRHLLDRLVRRDGAEVICLVRRQSVGKLESQTRGWPGPGRIVPLVGDLTEPLLGVSDHDRNDLRGRVDHVVHLAALYDMTADEATNEHVNIEGTLEALA